MRKIKRLIVHWTVSPRATTTQKQIKEWHEERGLGKGIQYHYLIIGDKARIVQTRSPEKIGYHCWGQNENSIGVALTLNNGENLNNDQKWALKSVLSKLLKKYILKPTDIFGHCEVAAYGHATECPGPSILSFLAELRFELTREAQFTDIFPAKPRTVLDEDKEALGATCEKGDELPILDKNAQRRLILPQIRLKEWVASVWNGIYKQIIR